MTIQYEVTEKDYIDFNKFHSRKHIKITYILLAVLCVVTAVRAIWESIRYYQATGLVHRDSIIHAVAFIGAFLIVGLLLLKPLFSWLIRWQIRAGKLPSFIGAQTLTLDDDHIAESNAMSSGQIKYAAVEKIYQHNGWCYIYISSIQALVVPLSAFQDPAQQAEFFAILKQHTGLDPVPA